VIQTKSAKQSYQKSIGNKIGDTALWSTQ